MKKRILYLHYILLILTFQLAGQWHPHPTVNTPISTNLTTESDIVSIEDGAGGAIIAWIDFRTGDGNVYAQRVDRDGNLLWTIDGITVCGAPNSQWQPDLATDGAGGVIVTWQDSRNGVLNYDIYAQRIDQNGVPQWTTDGVLVSGASLSQASPKVVADSLGGAIITWEDERNSIFSLYDIYAQRIDGGGNRQWFPMDGVVVSTFINNQRQPQIVSDAMGGAIITWEDERNQDTDIYAQRMDPSGVRVWDTTGVKISVAPGTQLNAKIVKDNAGGAIIAWEDNRDIVNNSSDIYSQRVDHNGATLWTTDGVAVVGIFGRQRSVAVTENGTGGAFYAWEDSRSTTTKIYVQQLDDTGHPLWQSDGQPISLAFSTGQYSPAIKMNPSGNVTAVWSENRSGLDSDLYAQKLAPDGSQLWPAAGVPVSRAIFFQDSPQIVLSQLGEVIVIWRDGRTGAESTDIYAQKLRASGELAGGKFTRIQTAIPNFGQSAAAWGDYDNDGDLDLVISGDNDQLLPSTELYRNDGNGQFSLETNATFRGVRGGAFDWGDYDGDNDLDLILMGALSNQSPFSAVYRNDGNGQFSPVLTSDDGTFILTGTASGDVEWVDYDNDGDLDFLLSGSSASNPYTGLYQNVGSDQFYPVFVNLSPLEFSSMDWMDYDRDGDMDLLIGGDFYNPGGGKTTASAKERKAAKESKEGVNSVTYLYRNDGPDAGPFQWAFTEVSNNLFTGLYNGEAAWADYDNDGDIDFTTISDIKTNIYRNDNSGIFAAIGNSIPALYSAELAWGDYDNDGDMDMLVAGFLNFNSEVARIYRNDGSDHFQEDSLAGIFGIQSGEALWSDFDQDGDLDILLTGFDSGSNPNTFLYRNDSGVLPNQRPTSPGNLTYAPTADSVKFSWSAASDPETPSQGLTYNMQLYNILNNTIPFSAMADPANGNRLKPDFGNTAQSTVWTLRDFPDGIYDWRVQAIDNSYQGSLFSAPGNFIKGSFTRLLNKIPAKDSTAARGASWGDYNNDGFLDLFVANSNEDNALYRNNGNGTFTKVTGINIVTDGGRSTGGSWGDFNNDGNLDLFVANANGENNFLYQNNGNETFTRILDAPMTVDGGRSTGGSWADFNNDGYLDLFVTNRGAAVSENNTLYQNNGDGTFSTVSGSIVSNDGGASNSSSWADFDNDGNLDLFVANTSSENNFLYQNNGDGSFTKITTGPIVTDGGSSAGGSWGDYDNDNDLDLFVTNTGSVSEVNFLYENNGDSAFTKISTGVIVTESEYSLGSGWADYDADGDLDLFVANQIVARATEAVYTINTLYENEGNGVFSKIINEDILEASYNSHAVAWADYSNDGYPDLFVSEESSTEGNFLYQNHGNANSWLNIALQGTRSNHSAIGARVHVKATINGQPVWQRREVSAQSGFGSQGSLNMAFGLLNATAIDSLIIEWPSGITQFLTNVQPNQFLNIQEILPTISLNPTSLDFGGVVVDSTDTLIVQVLNPGPVTLIVDSLKMVGPNATEFSSPFILEDGVLGPGKTFPLPLTFSPLSSGLKTATLNIYNNSVVSTATVALAGIGIGPSISLGADSVFFDTLDVGSMTSRTFTFTNSSPAVLVVDSIRVTGVDTAQFHLRSPGGSDILLPATSRNVTIEYAPDFPGLHSGEVAIYSNTDTNPDSAFLSGFGGIGNLMVAPTSLDYGIVPIGSNVFEIITIGNDGTGSLVLDSLRISGVNADEFSLVSVTEPDTLPRGQTRNISVQFLPMSEGPKTATLSIYDNISPTPFTVSLAGEGAERVIAFSTDSLNFDTLDVGSLASQQFTIINNNLTTLIIDSIRIAGLNPGQFQIPGAIDGDTLQPSASRDISIDYMPIAPGFHQAEAVVYSNAGTTPDSIFLDGFGGLGNLVVAPGQLDFGAISIGTSLILNVDISNNGTGSLILDSLKIGGTDTTEFSLLPVITPDTLFHGDTSTVSVRFSPMDEGVKNAFLTIYNNIPSKPAIVSLTGAGAERVIAFSADSLDFDTLDVGSQASQQFTIINNNLTTLAIDSIRISGVDQNQFQISGTMDGDTLQPSASRDIQIDYSPTAPGFHQAEAIVYSNAATTPDSIFLSGFGGVGNLTVMPTQLNYDTVAVGASLILNLDVGNDGTGSLVLDSLKIGGADVAEFSLLPAITPDTLSAGDNRTISVQFSPTNEGAKSATLTIHDNISQAPSNVSLSGVGALGELSVVPTALSFDSTEVGDSTDASITLTNIGTNDLILDSLKIDGTNPASFSIVNAGVPDTVSPGAMKSVMVRFKPESIGGKVATLNIFDNLSGIPFTVAMNGTGILGELSVSTENVLFDTTNVGDASQATVIVRNIGTSPFRIDSVKISGINTGEFNLLNNIAPDTLGTGSARNLDVQFTPGSTGDKSAALQIYHSLDTQPFSIALDGTGVRGSISVSAIAFAFDSVQVGLHAEQLLTIQNIGDGRLILDSLQVGGQNPTDFSLPLIPNTPDTLAPGDNREVPVRFMPVTAGPKAAYVTIHHSGVSSPQFITLSGTGIIGNISISPVSLTFDTLSIGSQQVQSVVVTNAGVNPLQITSLTISQNSTANFDIASGSPVSLLPGASATIDIRFSPLETGLLTASLAIQTDLSATPLQVSLQGVGIFVSLEPTVADTVEIGESPVLSVPTPPGFAPVRRLLFFRITGEAVYDSVELNLQNGMYTAAIPANVITPRGVEYYVLFSDGQQDFTFPPLNPTTNPAVLQVAIPAGLASPVTMLPVGYSMISVPLELGAADITSVLGDDYGEYDIDIWRILRWDAQNDQYVEFPDLTTPFSPGIAFWLITRDGIGFDVGEGLSTSSGDAYSLTIFPGWNQLGNPFAFSVDWDSIGNASLVSAPRKWNNLSESYDLPSASLAPWEGYFVFNPTTENVVLTVPPIENNGNAGKNFLSKNNNTEGEFLLRLNANGMDSGEIDHENYVGMSLNASEGFDTEDFLAPPSITPKLQLSVQKDDWQYDGNFMPVNASGAYWDIHIQTPNGAEPVRLNLEQITAIQDEFDIWLLDVDRTAPIAIKNGICEIPAIENLQKRTFRLIVGTENFAAQNNLDISLVPLEFELLQNYPNPFNPQTTIRYQLKERVPVRLDVYNVLGEHVRTLVNKAQNSGVYNIVWKGRDRSDQKVASGVYIYRIKAGSFVKTLKMALIR